MDDDRILQSKGAPFFGWLAPQYAALARGAVMAGLIAVAGFIVASIQSGAIVFPPEWNWLSSVGVLILQAIIGALDQSSVNNTAKARELKAAVAADPAVAPVVTPVDTPHSPTDPTTSPAEPKP